MSMREQMEAAHDRAAERRAARRDYEASTPLRPYMAATGKVHAARPVFGRPTYVTFACSGRSVANYGAWADERTITCKSCAKRVAPKGQQQ